MNDQIQPVLLVGLTMRMLAECAVRAGYTVIALDYFGDVDLQALCPSVSLLRNYETAYSAAALVDLADTLATPTVVYGASLENHPDQVARLRRSRHLLGNSLETLERVRDPVLLAEALREGGFAFPETVAGEAETVPDGSRRWLWKPAKSGGGHGVREWRVGDAAPSGDGILQERVPGMVGSAAFVADGRRAVVLGLTEQLMGQPVFGAPAFRYCGNLMPPRLPAEERLSLLCEIRALVSHLTECFQLRGLNGVDFIWHKGQVWTLEVNPRPVASLELIDATYDVRVFDVHVRSFYDELPRFELADVLTRAPAAGKAILYAMEDIQIGDTNGWVRDDIRDVPHSGDRIDRGHPVCTIIAHEATPAGCMQRLERRAAELQSIFAPAPREHVRSRV